MSARPAAPANTPRTSSPCAEDVNVRCARSCFSASQVFSSCSDARRDSVPVSLFTDGVDSNSENRSLTVPSALFNRVRRPSGYSSTDVFGF